MSTTKLSERSTPSPEPLEKPSRSPSLLKQVSITAAQVHHVARQGSKVFQYVPFVGAGWRTTVASGCFVATGVLMVNIAFLGWATTKPVDPFTSSRIVASGECNSVQNTITYSHLLINVLSTLLLGASNATMQCLSAPTRQAIDLAHRKGRWLDIGISSFRNWSYMDTWRKWCWLLLLFSTIPLHIVYNSALFSTTTANEYIALIVPSNFLDNTIPPSNGSAVSEVLNDMVSLAHAGKLLKLDANDCFETYNQRLVTEYANVLVVEKNFSNEMPIASYLSIPTPTFGNTSDLPATGNWLCGYNDIWTECDAAWQMSHPNTFDTSIPGRNDGEKLNVDHCLLQQTEAQCTVQLIPSIMVIVIVFNVVKVACFLAAIQVRSFHPLITLGDALASFLDRPDTHTTNLGPVSAADVREAETRLQVSRIAHPRRRLSVERSGETAAMVNLSEKLPFRFAPWNVVYKRWFTGASGLRWGLTYALMLGLWLLGWALFSIAAGNPLSGSFQSQWSIGFGNVSPTSLLESTSSFGLFGNVFLANAVQIIVSLTYISYNGLFTCILLSHEFTAYAHRRAGLRVSTPEGRNQRGSYWLSLPYQLGVPLLVLSGFLHWAISQSLFLAEVKVINPQGFEDPIHTVSCLGYSSLALFITLLLGAIMVFSPLILGRFRFHPGAPIVESNSIALSAACHPSHNNEAFELLKYGALSKCGEDEVGLSSDAVAPLQRGSQYTTHEELDEQMVAAMSPAAITTTHWQMLWAGILGFLNLAKAVCFVLWMSWIDLHKRPVNTFFPTRGTNWSVMVTAVPVTSLYLIIRMILAALRKYKKWNLRHFGWHVAPEAILCFIWIVILYGNVKYNGPIELPSGVITLHATDSIGRRTINLDTALSGGVMVSFFLSTCIEFWLWWQQHRASASMPVLHSVHRAKRKLETRGRW